MDRIVESLLSSQEPSIRFKALVNVLGREAKRMNEWVTADAVYVLKATGR
jgi:hypothetical protein